MNENKQLDDFASALGLFLGYIIAGAMLFVAIGLKMLLTWGLVWLLKFIIDLNTEEHR